MEKNLLKSKMWYKFLNEQDKLHERICELDPLGFDDYIEEVHELNRQSDIEGLADLLYKLLPRPQNIKTYDYAQAIAAMRDIGILMGSIKRHGYEPIVLVPELEYVLFELSDMTDLPPRDTLFHYTIWNPAGLRMRAYTGTPDEIELIMSVKISYRPLIYAIYLLMEMHSCAMDDSYFLLLCIRADKCFQGMIKGIINAKKRVSLDYFANELRFYFDPIIIHKEKYIGPGAVEMPTFVYDHLLWSSDTTDNIYKKFKTSYLPFNLPYIREIYYNYDGAPSMVSKMCEMLQNHNEDTDYQLVRNARALSNLCNSMKRFRMPHKKIADHSYDLQHERSVGSGGYSVDILAHILNLNIQQISSLDETIDSTQKQLLQ